MSFWSSLAGIAASFIPGVGAIAGPLVSAGLSKIGGGSSPFSVGPGGTTTPQANALATQNLLNSQLASNTGFGQVGKAAEDFATPENYYRSILSGNTADTTQALAPQIQAIQDRLNEALKTSSTLDPRGGGRASTLFSLPNQANTQITNLYNTARPAAAASLTDIGSREGSLGTGLISAGNSATGQGLANNLLSQQAQYGQSKDLGSAIGNIINGLNLGSIFKSSTPAAIPLPTASSTDTRRDANSVLSNAGFGF